MKRCIYCKAELSDQSVIDFCERCGIGVFGEKNFRAILRNFVEAGERGDLNQVGS